MITRQTQETKEKEQRDKFQKYLQRKHIEEQNQRSLLSAADPRREDFGKVYNIPIGVKSEAEKHQRAESLRRDVVQTLDQQREQKEAQRRLSRLQESELDSRNAAIQQEQFSNRSLNSKKYEQNQVVFDYYRQLHQQKQRRTREIDQQFAEKEQHRQTQEEAAKRQQEAADKLKRTLEMRDTLEQQVEIHNHRRQEEGRPNPEQATYAFISSIFRERKAPFDKKEYSLFLERQAEEQRLTRRQQHYMTEEEYRLNANQLHVPPPPRREPPADSTPPPTTTTGPWARSETNSPSPTCSPSPTTTTNSSRTNSTPSAARGTAAPSTTPPTWLTSPDFRNNLQLSVPVCFNRWIVI
jgi:hypothetical protein